MTPSARSMLRALCCVAAGGMIISGFVGAPSGAEPAPQELTASGSIDGLYPGSTGELSVRISSSIDDSVVMESLTAMPEPTRAGCERDLLVADMVGRRVVPAHGSIVIRLATSFEFSAPDACQNAVIPLVFTINGVEAAEAPPTPEPGGQLPQSGASSRAVAWIAATVFAIGAGILGLGLRRAR
jgi:hypothetical protein